MTGATPTELRPTVESLIDLDYHKSSGVADT